MKYKYVILYLAFALLFYRCGHPAKNVELNIIFCNQITAAPGAHFPKDLQDICLPIEDVCKPAVSLSFYPLTVKRVDIGKETSIDYQNNRASNYGKIKAVTRDLKKYFKDSTISASLSAETNSNFSPSNFLSENSNKENYLIFSDDEKLPAGLKRYDNVTDLRKAIAQLICDKNLSKIVVLYKPASAAVADQPPAINPPAPTVIAPPAQAQANPVAANPVAVKPVQVNPVPGKPVAINPVRPGPVDPGTVHRTSLNNLEKYFHSLARAGTSTTEKDKLKREILSLFTSPDVEVISVNSGQTTPTGITIGNYVESIYLTHKIVTIDHKQIENGKIFEIYVREE